eukprot:gene11535-15451_t
MKRFVSFLYSKSSTSSKPFLRRSKRVLKDDDLNFLEQLGKQLFPLKNIQIVRKINDSSYSPNPLFHLAKTIRSLPQKNYNNSSTKTFSNKLNFLTINKQDTESIMVVIGQLEQIENSLKDCLDSHTLAFPNIVDVGSEGDANNEFAVRIQFAIHYFNRIKESILTKELDFKVMTESQLNRLVDVILLGTSSERIAEHLTLFGQVNNQFNQELLQESFYSLYEPEIETCLSLFKRISNNENVHKHHIKRLPKFGNTYLLDKLELNAKARCVLAWSDPNYSGFNSVPKGHSMPLDAVIKGSLAQRRIYYYEKQDDRETLQLGFVFFVVTCLADWGLFEL